MQTQTSRMTFGFSPDRWAAGSTVLGLLLVVLSVALVLFTGRIELGAVVALPLVILLLGNFHLAATVTVWVALVWLLRIPAIFFDLVHFSYVVYASVVLTIVAYMSQVMVGGQKRLPLITNKWIWLLLATIIGGGIHGAGNVGSIPKWVLASSEVDLGVPWIYYRTVVFPGVLLPVIAILVAAALCDKPKLTAISAPIWTVVCVVDLLIIGQVLTAGDALSVLATLRSEHLTNLGLHSNDFGAFLAIAYGFGLGMWDSTESGRSRTALGALSLLTAVALLLTFSRGAYLAFAVVTVVVFVRGAPKKRAALLLLTSMLWLAAPAALVERVSYGMTSKDVNAISAGRVENVWMPLLPDIADHLWFGQGLHSVMWTDAQLFEEIYPVNNAHNAFLDLLLDFGLIGAIPIVAWYVYIWSGFYRRASSDPEPQYRAFFFGSHLAVLAFLLYALTNSRLTPTAPACLLWIAAGVLIGRIRQSPEARAEAAPVSSNQSAWRRLTVPKARPRLAALNGV